MKIFYQLIDLLKTREKVPDYKEFPKINPFLNNYDFPYQIYSNEFLDYCLREERIKKIEYSILNQNSKDSQYITIMIKIFLTIKCKEIQWI